MAIRWEHEERTTIEDGIARYPAESNRCAALARIVYRVAQPKDERTRGIQLEPAKDLEPARWLVPKRQLPRRWGSHTLVETQEHRIDAFTGADGHAASEYLAAYFHFHADIDVREVDVFAVDPWIEEEGR